MISLNHSSGLLGVDCDNTPHSIIVCVCVYTCVCLSALYDCDIIRINSFRRYARLQAGRRQALANRTCKSNLHGTSSYNSRRLRRSSPVHFRSSRSSRAHFRRATFRVSPLGPAAGLRKVRHRRCIHTHTHVRTELSRLYF